SQFDLSTRRLKS
nr:Chain E, Meditope [synthetic construct]5ICY_F Chain F, Meditope [synthetic construct]